MDDTDNVTIKNHSFNEPAGDPDQVQLDSVLYIEAVVARAPQCLGAELQTETGEKYP